MLRCADRLVHPLFPAEESAPPAASSLHFAPVTLATAKTLNRLWHSRFPEFGGGGMRAAYAAEWGGVYYAVAIWTNPSSPKLPQRAWLMLKRWAIADDAPPQTASRMMSYMLRHLRRTFREVTTLVSYSDPQRHEGGIYRACSWEEGETTPRLTGAKLWHNRQRGNVAANEPCELVTRWTKRLR